MYGEMVLDSFNLNIPGMIIFRPIMIIRKVKENIICLILVFNVVKTAVYSESGK